MAKKIGKLDEEASLQDAPDLGDYEPIPDGEISSTSKNQVVTSPPESSTPSADTQPNPIAEYKKYLVTPEDLKERQSGMQKAGALGTLADALGNSQSFGNFYSGRMAPHRNTGGQLQHMLEQRAQAPIQQKQAKMSQWQKQPELELSSQMRDSTSGVSKIIANQALLAINQIQSQPDIQKDDGAMQFYDELKSQIPKQDGYTNHQIIEKNPLLKDMFASSIAGQRLLNTREMFGTRMTNDVNKQVNNDRIIQGEQAALDGVKRIQDIIDDVKSGKLVDTTTIKNSIGNEYAKLETGLRSLGLGQEERSTIRQNFEEEFNNKIMYPFFKQVKGGALPAEAMKQLQNEIDTMRTAHQQQYDERSNQLANGSIMPGLVKKKTGGWKNEHINRGTQWNGLNDQKPPQKDEVGPHGPSVVQHGHEFIWNPKTKAYE